MSKYYNFCSFDKSDIVDSISNSEEEKGQIPLV